MAVEPALQVVLFQVDTFVLPVAQDVVPPFGPVVVIEEDDGRALGQLRQVVLQPATDVGHGVARPVVAATHRRDDVVDPAGVERVIDGAVALLVECFSALSLYQIVVTDAVIHGPVHVVRVHEWQVGRQSPFVADVARVDDEGGAGVGGVGTQVVEPVVLPHGRGDFRVGDLDEAVRAVAADARIVGAHAEVVDGRPRLDVAVEGAGHVAARRGDEDEARLRVAGQPVVAVARRSDDVEPVGDGDAAQRPLAPVVPAVGIGVDVDAAFTGHGAVGRHRGAGQQGGKENCVHRWCGKCGSETRAKVRESRAYRKMDKTTGAWTILLFRLRRRSVCRAAGPGFVFTGLRPVFTGIGRVFTGIGPVARGPVPVRSAPGRGAGRIEKSPAPRGVGDRGTGRAVRPAAGLSPGARRASP